jgi:hypothetical protein
LQVALQDRIRLQVNAPEPRSQHKDGDKPGQMRKEGFPRRD